MRATRLVIIAAMLGLAACSSGAGVTQPDDTASVPAPTVTEAPSPGATAAPTTTAAPTPTASPEPTTSAGAASVTAYFLRSGADNIWVEPTDIALDEPSVAVARAAVEALFTEDPVDPGLAAPTEADVEVLGADIDDGVLTVDVSSELAEAGGGSAAEQGLAQALAHTATQFDGVDAVQLWVEGESVTDLWGHLDWSQPVEPDPFAVSPIVVTSPEWDAQVDAGSLTVRGTANVFEATVALRLLDPEGNVAEDTFTTATCGSGCRGDWEHTFDTELTPGRWTVEAEEPDPSGGEGRTPFVARVEFEVG